tara:strand:+ start:447 stop:773 length:327 start_codon:yes stop_codon:yes gene_type:complete
MNYVKYIIPVLFFVLVTSFTYKNKSKKNTEVTVSIPQLANIELANHLKNEIIKHKNIDYMNGSLESKTIVFLVDEDLFSKKEIDNMLSKWGCHAQEYYFRKIYNSNNF